MNSSSPFTPVSSSRSTHVIGKKKLAFELFDQCQNQSEVARQLKIDRSVVSKWIKNRSKIEELSVNTPNNKKRLTPSARKAFFPQLEVALLDWLVTMRRDRKMVTYRSIKRKAQRLFLEIYPNLNVNDFKASNGWIMKFIDRHNLSYRKPNHTAQQTNKTLEEQQKVIINFLSTIQKKIKTYKPQYIINMDETPLYFDMLVSKTVDFTGNKSIDCETTGGDKNRFTACLSITANGDVLKALVILKNLKKVPKIDIPSNIYLTVSEKGTMSIKLMLLYLEHIVEPYIPFNERCLLIVDSLRAHINEDVLKLCSKINVDVEVIPPGFTSVLQPLDVSINKPFKVYYRSSWNDWFENSEAEYTKGGIRKRPSYQKIIDFVHDTLQSIQSNMDVVIRSFSCCGFNSNFRLDQLNGKLKSYFELNEDWDQELAIEDLIRNCEKTKSSRVNDVPSDDDDNEVAKDDDDEDRDDNMEICLDNIFEIEKRLLGEKEETEGEFNSKFVRL